MTEQTEPIAVHSFPTPNGKKITVMLEELGVPYEHFAVDIRKDEQFDPEFLEISPNNKIPAIVDPEGPGGAPISVFESGAILKYLGQKFSRFYPADPREQVEVDQWLMWQMGGFGPMLGQANHFIKFAKEDIPYAKDRYRNESKRLFGVLDKRLADRDYVAGDVSVADFAIIGWADLYEWYDIDLADFPNFAAWHARMHARPATKKGLEIIKVD